MKLKLLSLSFLFLAFFIQSSVFAQDSEMDDSISNFEDRAAIIETVKNWYIGDHTGSLEHKRLSMHPDGAYRYVNREGEYGESQFRFEEGGGDMNYEEELLSIDIHGTVATAKLRLAFKSTDKIEYKTMILHKTNDGWLVTSIIWGFGTVQ